MNQPASVKTIAAALGISAAAVSKALNDKPDIGAELKAAVRAEAARQGFALNRGAQALARGRSTSVGLFLLNRFGRPVREYFGFHLLDGMLERCQEADLDLLLLQDQAADGRPLDLASQLRTRNVAAAIVYGIDPADPRAAELATCGRPVITVETPLPGLPLVASDHESAMAELVASLLAAGFRAPAYLGLRGEGWVARARLSGFRRACAGRHAPETMAPLDMAGGAAGAAAIRAAQPDTDLIICASDLQAWGARAWLREQGIAIPAQVAVSGFDDLQASALLEPPLTTIAQDPRALGRTAASIAIGALDGPVPDTTFIPAMPIFRASTARH